MGLADEPIAGGRHKVFGHPDLAIIPQTSTIASHLPARGRAGDRAAPGRTGCGVDARGRADAVVVCSFGDASANHSTAVGAINTALQPRLPGSAGADPVRLRGQRPRHLGADAGRLDRGGVRIAARLRYLAGRRRRSRSPHWPASPRAADTVRAQRQPVFLHLRTVRFLGHAGSDAEISYRKPREIEADYARDPLLGDRPCLRRDRVPAARDAGALRRHRGARSTPRRTGSADDPRLGSAAEMMAPLAPRHPAGVQPTVAVLATRRASTPKLAPDATARPRTLAESINATLDRAARRRPAGDRLRRGRRRQGRGLRRHRAAGPQASAPPACSTRCSTSSRSSVSGSAPDWPGCCRSPRSSTWPTCTTPKISFAARRRPCRSSPAVGTRNPMVVRIAGLGLPEGLRRALPQRQRRGVLRDIPGLVVGVPARADDARRDAAHLRRRRERRRHGVGVPRTDRALPPPRSARAGDGGWLGSLTDARATCRSVGPRSVRHGDRHRPDHDQLRQRRADEPAGRPPPGRGRHRAPRCSTCAGSLRCRSTTCWPPPGRPDGCWSSTRPGTAAGSAKV